jgi:hypothetical protein
MGFGSVTNQALRQGATVELVLNQLVILGESPVLVVEHLGESNRAFWNAALAEARATTKAGQAGRVAKLTDAQVAKARMENRETVAKYSVRATHGFFHDRVDAPGIPDSKRPAGPEDIRDVVMSLPDEVFDSVMAFVVNPENFRERAIADDPKAIAGK